MTSRWRSWGGSGRFGVTCHCVRMQRVPTQTAQSTHVLPFSSVSLESVERESTSIFCLSRTIAHHLIVAPLPPSRKLLQIARSPTKEASCRHSNCRKSTPAAHMISWEGNIKSCIDNPIDFFRAIEPDRLRGPFRDGI